jgi:hypothetical protein
MSFTRLQFIFDPLQSLLERIEYSLLVKRRGGLIASEQHGGVNIGVSVALDRSRKV